MQALSTATSDEFSNVRFVLTDMDETLTYNGRLAAQTYRALERLQENGVRVIPVTAAPAGWCDQMARMWPVDGIIGENGGLFFQRDKNDAHALVREFWHGDAVQDVATQLQAIAARVQREVPEAIFADDQPFRTTSVAFSIPRTQPNAIGSRMPCDAPAPTSPSIICGYSAGLAATKNCRCRAGFWLYITVSTSMKKQGGIRCCIPATRPMMHRCLRSSGTPSA